MIKAFCGRYGSGKTLSMVQEAYIWLPRGINIISNVNFAYRRWTLYSPKDMQKKKKLGYWEFFKPRIVTSMPEYFSLFGTEKNTIFVMDEAGIWLDSYNWESVSSDVYARFQQTRKVNIHLLYTAQFFNFVVRKLRQITDVVVQCDAPFRLPPDPKLPYDKGKPLLINKISYNPTFYEQKGIASVEQEQKFIEKREWIFGVELNHVFHSYDTSQIVK